MRAVQYVGGESLVVNDVDPVAPGPSEVQIRVAFTGICGTDLHILHGAMDSRVSMPAVIGHEMSGRIAAIGEGVVDWTVGDLVTVMPLRWCGVCAACRAGHSHICENLDFVGIDSPGAMQQLWTVPAELLVRLPETMDLRHGALVEPVAVAVHDVGRGGVEIGDRVVVVGGGPVGLLVACVAREAGADVVVVEVDAFRRSVIESTGFRVLDPLTTNVADQVQSWTEGAGASISFEVSGSQPGLDTALNVLGVRGRMVVVGIHPADREISMHRIFWRELSIVGARVYQRADFESAVDLVARGVVPTDALITAVQPLDSAASAFEALSGGGEVMKILIDCGTP